MASRLLDRFLLQGIDSSVILVDLELEPYPLIFPLQVRASCCWPLVLQIILQPLDGFVFFAQLLSQVVDHLLVLLIQALIQLISFDLGLQPKILRLDFLEVKDAFSGSLGFLQGLL